MTINLTDQERASLESIAEELADHPRLRAVSKAVNLALDETAPPPTDFGAMVAEAEWDLASPAGWQEASGIYTEDVAPQDFTPSAMTRGQAASTVFAAFLAAGSAREEIENLDVVRNVAAREAMEAAYQARRYPNDPERARAARRSLGNLMRIWAEIADVRALMRINIEDARDLIGQHRLRDHEILEAREEIMA